MANTTLQVKKSGITGNVPSSLEFGELALNYADGKLYYKASNGTITYIQSGTPTDSFATINANSSLIFATSPTDTLSISAGNNITISACTTTKTITINSQDADVDQFARDAANSAATLAQSAYNTANDANGLAQGAYDYANTQISIITGINDTQNTRLNSVESINNDQNTSITVIQEVNSWQNNQIVAVNQFAQSAYNQANTSGGSSNLSSILYTLYSAPIGDYGLITDSLYSSFDEYIAVEYDCRATFPAGSGILVNDWNLT